MNLKSEGLSLWAHAHAASPHVVNVAPSHLELSSHIALGLGFSAHNNLASVSIFAWKSESTLEALLLGSHQSSHSSFDLSNQVILGHSIAVHHFKLELLLLFKEVIAGKAGVEIWIQIVIDLLCSSKLLPLLSLINVLI